MIITEVQLYGSMTLIKQQACQLIIPLQNWYTVIRQSILFNALNWSYSKGDTLNCACVILTDKFEKLDEDDFKVGKIPSSTINKLYVAMTRSRGDLYLVKASVFKKIQKEFIKN